MTDYEGGGQPLMQKRIDHNVAKPQLISIPQHHKGINSIYLFNRPIMLTVPSIVDIANKTLGWNPLPNPYHVPSTDTTLFFAISGEYLAVDDTYYCFRDVFNTLSAILAYGDASIIRPLLEFRYRTVLFRLMAVGTVIPRITYNQTVAVLIGLEKKMEREGNREWVVQVRRSPGNVHVARVEVREI